MTKNCKWLFQDSPALLLVLDEQLICRDMTSVWRQQLASPESVDAGIPSAELFDVENNPALPEQFNAVIKNGVAMVDIAVDLLMAGETLKARLSAWLVQHPDDEQSCIMVAATDESEFNRAYKELSQLQIEHQLILDAAGEGIYGLDSDGNTTFGNIAATKILGWEIDDIRGRSAHGVHHHSHPDGTKYPLEECPIYAGLKDGRFTVLMTRYSGTPMVLLYRLNTSAHPLGRMES